VRNELKKKYSALISWVSFLLGLSVLLTVLLP